MMNAILIILLMPIAFVTFMCVCQIPAVLVSRFERRSVWPYEDRSKVGEQMGTTHSDNPYAPPPVASVKNIPIGAYAAEQLNQAVRLGFRPLASTSDQSKKLVQVRYDFLISPDRRMIAIVSFGTVASIPVQTVFMVSQLKNDLVFSTLGAHAACNHDLNQKRTEMLVSGADFQTMQEYHRKRCELLGAHVKPFNENEELETLYRYRVRFYSDYESRGLINYIDKDHREWKYTWKGAFLFVLYASVRQLRRLVYPDRWLAEPMLTRVNS